MLGRATQGQKNLRGTWHREGWLAGPWSAHCLSELSQGSREGGVVGLDRVRRWLCRAGRQTSTRPANPLPPTSACGAAASAAPGPGPPEASPPRLGRPPCTSPHPRPQGTRRGCSLGLEPSFSRSSHGCVPPDLRLSSRGPPPPQAAAVLACMSGRRLLGPVAWREAQWVF